MSPIEVRQAEVGNYENNVYVLVDPATKASLLIDTPFEPEKILELVEGTDVKGIVFTHADPDHLGAFEAVTRAVDAPVMIHSTEAGSLPKRPDRELAEGDTIQFGESSVQVIHTPGHTAGSICLLTGGTLISGDTLFPGGPGNTRRPGGDFNLIMSGIRDKLFVLPDDTVVYPGHGSSTTIGVEKPHLEEWMAFGG